MQKFVLCLLCLSFVCCAAESYKAAIVEKVESGVRSQKYTALINEAAKSNVDLLLLPRPTSVIYQTHLGADGLESSEEVVKSISAAAKDGQLYVVAPLYERIKCQNKNELVRSSLVFDREGELISVHKSPVNSNTRCNTTTSRIERFTTDFGVTFGIVAEEDFIITNAQEVDGIKNLVLTHDSPMAKKSFLFAEQFPWTWAYVNNANIITSSGVFGAKGHPKRTSNLMVSKLRKNGNGSSNLISNPPSSFPSENLSQYIVKPVNVEASLQGYTDSVCHGRFCCQFYVKTSVIGANLQDLSYGLVAFDGIHQTGRDNIGIQSCSLVACAGLYKRSCFIGSENSTTNIKFDKISITADFPSDNTAQFPAVLTTTQTTFNADNLKFTIEEKDFKSVTTEVYNTENLLTFGIIGRDYSKDFEFVPDNNTEDVILDFSDYISAENVQEFFDYMWIRLRVLIFIVSVYILEMM